MSEYSKEYNKTEIMAVVASRQIKDGDIVFVGIGVPNLAVTLARFTHAPNVTMIYESGVIGARPARVPLSIGDPIIVTGCLAITSMFEIFSQYLQPGRIDVGFLGGAQIDKYGNINSTVIGDYEKPKVRLPGSGGGCDIITLAKRTLITTPHTKRRLPERVDFITSPGYLDGPGAREREMTGRGGPEMVITDKGVMRFDEETKELYLAEIYPGVTLEEVKENTGWDLKISQKLIKTEPPTKKEITLLREKIDPYRYYI